jgi:hypothetical protein
VFQLDFRQAGVSGMADAGDGDGLADRPYLVAAQQIELPTGQPPLRPAGYGSTPSTSSP